ncbi:MAG: DUF2304 domain-containing protein [Lachnospiraceae bacterium]|nr:DUF2304 domain-containing protein [Lachnospiraceae bacterium]
MSTSLRIFALVLIAIYFVIIVSLLKRKKFALKYSLLWFLAGILMLIVVIWTDVLVWGADLLGIEVASNGLFGICILLEIMIMISITSVISDLTNRLTSMIQNMALMERRIRILEEKLECKGKGDEDLASEDSE